MRANAGKANAGKADASKPGTRKTKASRHVLTLALLILPTAALNAANPISCDSGNPANWLSVPQITERLTADGWAVSSVVSENGCWKVSGNTPAGARATGYFHPLSGEKLLIKSRGKILYQSGF